ncbi:MAG: cytochrome c family protein [Candidatus Eisenbacteria sp.]|nr:cytochrome c family protein [Candidatus Eisenbacteria bacterium]
MRKIAWLGAALLLVVALVWVVQANGEEAKKAEEQEHGFIGALSCKACHKSEAKGDQYGKWLASPHAHAYQSLLTDESKKIAKELGIEVAPEEAAQCLKCHVTAWDAKAELFGKKYDKIEGVSCESCHGPAADWKIAHMKDVEKAMTLGMIAPAEELCLSCHNDESPTFKEFKFEEAMAVVAHPNPKKAGEGE